MSKTIWIPEHGDAGLIVPADHIMERERQRGPETAATPPNPSAMAPEPPPPDYVSPAPPTPAQRRQMTLLMRRVMRRQRRKAIRADNRLLYWAHVSGRGPRPPIQAVRDPRKWISMDLPEQALAA